MFSPIPELLEEIRAGRMIVVVDDEDRENEGDLIMAASMVRPEDINFMARHARGLICLSLTRERCAQLRLPPMVSDNTSPYRTNFTVSIEAAEGVTTGISAYDRAHTIRTAVRPDAKPSDLSQPGHVFPLQAQPGGVLTRAGHTEAACDLALLAGLEPAGVLVEILNEDGSMARRPQLETFAREHGLKIGTIADLIQHRLQNEHTIERVDEREVDTDHGPFKLVTYRDRIAHELHFALVRGEVGAPARAAPRATAATRSALTRSAPTSDAPTSDAPTLVRVHVKNQLSDLLHLERADLGLSLSGALAEVAREGRGVVVVLSQPSEPDTVLARLREQPLPQPGVAEWRRNGAGAQILADLGCTRLRVLGTPRKQVALAGFGLEVVEYVSPASEREPAGAPRAASERLPAAPGKLGA